ncbi:unnamed protein product [Clavelina lepadiformis]|uniref:Transmembrane protein 198 n=1 Tax=Clavelina lepadiformis TaxID=159417 RepID=A0ABP0FQI2_CLALP
MSRLTASNITVVCDEIQVSEYDVVVSIVSGTLGLLGLVYCFFGYRCFKGVMFLSGLIFGSATVFLLCREERLFQQEISMEMATGIAAGIGILCGLITLLILYAGLFLQGFFLGTLLAIAGMIALQSFYHPSTAWIPVSIIFGTGVACSVLTLKFQRNCVLFSTAVLGSALITVCIDYFMEQFLLLRYIWEALMAAPSINVCWYTWVILSVWPALCMAGTLLQWKVTSSGYDHTKETFGQTCQKQQTEWIVHTLRRSHNQRRPNQRSGATSRSARSVPPSPPRTRRQDEAVHEEANFDPNVGGTQQPNQGYDTLPPSYFECTELGIGEPVTSSHTVVHTDQGAYVSRPPAGPGRSQTNIQRDLLQGVSSGSGYVVENNPDPRGGYVGNVQLRNAQRQENRRAGRDEPNHQDINNFSNQVTHSSSRQGSNHGNGSEAQAQSSNRNCSENRSGRRFRPFQSSRSHRSNSGTESDTQSLLSQQPKPPGNREAVSAHAERLRAAENKRNSRQSLGTGGFSGGANLS